MTLTWINRRSDPILELQLNEEGETKESLQFNPVNESVRINCDGYQQVFFLDNGKAWNDRVVYKNAYGIEYGDVTFDRYPSLSGTINLDSQIFLFNHNRKTNTIEMVNADASEIRLTALLPLEDNLPASYPVPDKRIEMDATILLLLCWNLMKMPAHSGTMLEYSS